MITIISESGEKYRLLNPRSAEFTHSHYESFGGGYFCYYDLIVDFANKTVKMFSGGESCEFKIAVIIS